MPPEGLTSDASGLLALSGLDYDCAGHFLVLTVQGSYLHCRHESFPSSPKRSRNECGRGSCIRGSVLHASQRGRMTELRQTRGDCPSHTCCPDESRQLRHFASNATSQRDQTAAPLSRHLVQITSNKSCWSWDIPYSMAWQLFLLWLIAFARHPCQPYFTSTGNVPST